MAQSNSETIWVVVRVSRGLAHSAEAYSDRRLAYLREKALRTDMHVEYDDSDVFEVCIRDSLPPAPTAMRHRYRDR